MTIIITLSFAGNETGPFDLYSDATGFATPFAQNVSKAALLAGYQVEAPDGTTTVRLYNLQFLCAAEPTDIYSCATPNCDFTGSILCDITTTTTTSSSTSSTTTTAYPEVALCTWSTYGGNSGEIGIYNMVNNTVSAVLVPNDFQVTQGVTRPICATQTKLWLSGETDGDPLNFIIKEYNINNISSPPSLSFVREITVSLENISQSTLNTTGNQCTTINAINNTTLLVGFGGPTADYIAPQLIAYNLDISATGNITVYLPSDSSDKIYIGPNANTTYGNISHPGVLYLNNGQVISTYRVEYENNPDDDRTGNWIQQKTLDTFPNTANVTAAIKLQDLGIPEFTSGYTGEKYMDIFSREGILYVLHPETLVLYRIQQEPPYTAFSEFTITLDAPSVFSATGCSNVDLYYEDPCDDVTALPILNEIIGFNSPGEYIGPVEFNFQGMIVEGSSISATESPIGFALNTTEYPDYLGAFTGLSIPQSNCVILSGQQFDYTITFPEPVNNIAVRVGVLNTALIDGEFAYGDIYQADTNTETPTITISNGYGVNVVGNQFGGGVYSDNYSNGEFIINCETDYTVLTISGQAPTGGPIALACPQTSLNCIRFFTDITTNDCIPGACAPENDWPPSDPKYHNYYAHNIILNTVEQITLPAASQFVTPNSDISNNYLVSQITITDDEDQTASRFTRYQYSDASANGTPQNVSWDGVIYEIDRDNDTPSMLGKQFRGVSVINDDVMVLSYYRTSPNVTQVFEAEFVPGSTTLAVTLKFQIPNPFNGGSEHVVTFKEDGVTPNKFIAIRQNDSVVLSQFDYATGNFEGDIQGPSLGNWRSYGDMCVVGDFLYITLRDINTNTTELWSVNFNTNYWSIVSSDSDYFGGSSGSLPSCRITNGFTLFPPPTTTTTTTATVGINTIWTRFDTSLPA